MQRAEQAPQSLSVGLIMQQPNTQRTEGQSVFNGNCCFHTQTRLHKAPYGPHLLDMSRQLPEYFHSLHEVSAAVMSSPLFEEVGRFSIPRELQRNKMHPCIPEFGNAKLYHVCSQCLHSSMEDAWKAYRSVRQDCLFGGLQNAT